MYITPHKNVWLYIKTFTLIELKIILFQNVILQPKTVSDNNTIFSISYQLKIGFPIFI